MPCKSSTWQHESVCKSEIASGKTPKTIYGRKVEAHESTRQRVEASRPGDHEHHRQRVYFDDPWNFGAQDDPSMAIGESKEQKRWLSWKHTERKRKSTLLH